jgi:Caspase domain
MTYQGPGATGRSRNRWALAVGINDYQYGPRLAGAVNDVKLMADILQRTFGFPASHVRLLLDGEATAEAIRAEMDALLGRAAPDDVVIMYFSGHSTRISVQDGHQQSALVPADLLDSTGLLAQAITADELHDWLFRLAASTPNAALILDTSSGGFSDPQATPVRSGTGGYVVLEACRPDEFAYDHLAADSVHHGVFTYVLGESLLRSGPQTTYRELFGEVTARVAARFPRQHPQVQGDVDRVIFGASRRESRRLVSVARRRRDSATLDAGAAHGMTVGSQWAIYAPDAGRAWDDSVKAGLVEIMSVKAVESEAKILSEASGGAITPGAAAVEEMHDYGEMRLVVQTRTPPDHGGQQELLAKLLTESELVRVAQPDEPADVTVHLVPPRVGADEDDVVPQLKHVTEPTWAVVDKTARLIMPPLATEGSSAAYVLRDNLERTARYRNLLELRNPNPRSQLLGKVGLLVKRQADDGRWTALELDPETGIPLLHEGERIGLEVINHYTAPIYLTLLDFGLTGRITQLYPSTDGTDHLDPGGKLQLGFREEDWLMLGFPADFPFVRDPHEAEPGAGLETVKLFATAYPTDFSGLLLREGFRGVVSTLGESTVLWQLLDTSLTGRGTRGRRPTTLPPEQDWTTAEHSFWLRRRG